MNTKIKKEETKNYNKTIITAKQNNFKINEMSYYSLEVILPDSVNRGFTESRKKNISTHRCLNQRN